MKAINSKHQANVNRATAWLFKYNESNKLRDEADGDGDDKLYYKYDRLCQKQFDKFLEYMAELPRREQQQIYKSKYY